MEKEQLYKEMLERYQSQLKRGVYDFDYIEEQLQKFIEEEEYLKAEATKRALETLRHEVRS